MNSLQQLRFWLMKIMLFIMAGWPIIIAIDHVRASRNHAVHEWSIILLMVGVVQYGYGKQKFGWISIASFQRYRSFYSLLFYIQRQKILAVHRNRQSNLLDNNAFVLSCYRFCHRFLIVFFTCRTQWHRAGHSGGSLDQVNPWPAVQLETVNPSNMGFCWCWATLHMKHKLVFIAAHVSAVQKKNTRCKQKKSEIE